MEGTVKNAKLGFTELALRDFAWCMVHCVQRPKLCSPKQALDKPTIFACSHVGLMDPVVLMVQYYNMIIHPLVALDYYQKNGFTRKFYDVAQCIPIDRINHSQQWLEDSVAALAKGESIIIFPEGKRNKSGKGLLPFHVGVAVLAARSGARVVPVFNKMWKFPHRYRLAMGEPITLDPLMEGSDFKQYLKEQTKRIQDAVAALEPLV